MRRVLAGVVVATALVAWGALAAPVPQEGTVARTFHLKHRPLDEATRVVQPLLSGGGNLTVYPGSGALTVRDTRSVVELVALVLREYDRPDPVFRVQVTLLEAFNGEGQGGAGAPAEVDPRIRKMFPFTTYRKLGTAVLEWDAPGPISTTLGGDYLLEGQAAWSQLRTDAVATPAGEGGEPHMTAADLRTAWRLGGADMVVSMLRHRRLVIEDLTLDRRDRRPREGGDHRPLLRTRVVLAPNQQVVLGLSPSEDARRAMIIVLRALEPRRRSEER